MAENRGVTYQGPGNVEVTDLDYPGLVLRDGPGVHPELPAGTVPARYGEWKPEGAPIDSFRAMHNGQVRMVGGDKMKDKIASPSMGTQPV